MLTYVVSGVAEAARSSMVGWQERCHARLHISVYASLKISMLDDMLSASAAGNRRLQP